MADKLIHEPKLDPKASKFTLKIKRSKIHRYGVFTMKDIPKRTRVIEYTGERISRREMSRRLEGEFTYIFLLDSYWGIDGAVNGSGAEIINHCCEPNLEAEVTKDQIYYVSLRPIMRGESSRSTTRSIGNKIHNRATAARRPAAAICEELDDPSGSRSDVPNERVRRS
jgi:uncharacterized protein